MTNHRYVHLVDGVLKQLTRIADALEKSAAQSTDLKLNGEAICLATDDISQVDREKYDKK